MPRSSWRENEIFGVEKFNENEVVHTSFFDIYFIFVPAVCHLISVYVCIVIVLPF